MSGNFSDGLKARIPQWKAQLWQVMEAQYQPWGHRAVQDYLRKLLAYFSTCGLEGLVHDVEKLSLRLAESDEPDREAFEEGVREILGDLAIQADLVEDPPALRAFIVRLQPGQDFLSSSLDLGMVFARLRELGNLEIFPDIDACPLWEHFDPLRSGMRWNLILTGSIDTDRVQDVLDLLASEDGMVIKLESDPGPARLQELRLANTVPPIPEKLQPGPGNPSGYQRRASDRGGKDADAQQGQGGAGGASIRMSIERLDKIINSVGELVTAQGRLKDIADQSGDGRLESVAEDIERLTLILRDASMRLRMQPVGALFSRFHRLVRDLSQNLGKEVELVTEGEETEIDRTVLEKIYDPMVHLIRNSLDHGIESRERRAAAGKPETGTILIKAFQRGPEVIIQVADDGGGIDPEKVFAKAVEKNLVKPDMVLEERQILDLIFMPGFSTAATVSDVSGRGVGMDVVKSNVEALRGQVDISSVLGEGTTMTLHFPLTMAIIDGLQVEVAGERYIIPLDPVEECLDLLRYDDGGVLLQEFREGKQGLFYNLRGTGISLFSLSTILKPGANPGTRVIIVRSSRGDRYALAADAIIGRLQVVIKPLGPLHLHRKELSGATILGDGGIALVLDLPNIIRRIAAEGYGKTIHLS